MTSYLIHKALMWLAYINLGAILLFFYLCRNDIIKKLKAVKGRYWGLLLIVFTLGVFIRVVYPPHHVFFIDESFYMGAAKNMAKYLNPAISNLYYPKQIGWPVLLSIPFALFGVGNYAAIYTSIFFGSLSLVLIFILVFLAIKSQRVAILSSFLLAIFPMHIIYSNTAETISASVFFVLLTLIIFFMAAESLETRLICLVVFLFAFAIQLRFENILLLIPMLFFFLLKKIKLDWKKAVVPSAIAIIFLASYALQLNRLIDFYYEIYSRTAALLGINSLPEKLQLIPMVFADPFYAVLLILAIIGCIKLYSGNKPALVFFAGMLLVYLAFYLFYNYADDFHVLTGLIGLIPAVGYGLNSIFEYTALKVKNVLNAKNMKWEYIIPIGGALMLFMLFLMSFNTDPDPSYILETKTIAKLNQDIPNECIVVTEIPAIVTSVTELVAVEMKYFLEKTDDELTPYKGKCLLYYENIYCSENILPNSQKRCGKMHSRFKLKIFKEYRYMNAGFYLYNIYTKA